MLTENTPATPQNMPLEYQKEFVDHMTLPAKTKQKLKRELDKTSALTNPAQPKRKFTKTYQEPMDALHAYIRADDENRPVSADKIITAIFTIMTNLDDTGECRLSNKEIAEKMGMTVNHLYAILNYLERPEIGFLQPRKLSKAKNPALYVMENEDGDSVDYGKYIYCISRIYLSQI